MEMIGKEFLDRFHHYIHQWWPARALLEKAISKRFDVDFHKKEKISLFIHILYF